MKKIFTLILTFISISSYSQYSSFEDAKVFKFLTISGQPSQKTIDRVKKEKFDIILDLRNPGEFNDFNEKKYTEENGLSYHNIPFFDKENNITKENISNITNFIEKNKDKKIFVHCSSGNRASSWLLIHLNKDHNMPLPKAIEITRNTGLTKDDLRTKVLQFIKEP
mgnify:CR=1 FL=1